MVKAVVVVVPHIRLKLQRIFRRHEQMKTAFNNLRSQIKTGLIEAEDVFDSLSIPLMKLVGLKTEQMAQEGRSSTILFHSSKPTLLRNASRSARSPFLGQIRNQLNTFEKEDRHRYNKATEEGKKLIEKQRLQLQQLVHLLRRIEAQVNSHQDNIIQTLADHRVHLHKFFQQSISYLSSIHQTGQTNEAFLVASLKLLRATFEHVSSALWSVQDVVENLIGELSEEMCIPLMDYVKGLKAEMASGALIRLVAVVEEMKGVVRDGQAELEEARRMVRVEEERKLEALSRLKDAEEKRRAMKEFVGYLLEAKKRSKEPVTPRKVLVMEEDDAGEEKLLWDLLKKKNKLQAQASPFGALGILQAESNNKIRRHRGDIKISAKIEPMVSHRPVTRSSSKAYSPGTPCVDTWPCLGASPSVVNQQRAVHKHISPLLRVRKGTLC